MEDGIIMERILSSWSDADRAYMQEAIALAERGRGHTAPTPMVGCVLVKDGRVYGVRTKRYSLMHFYEDIDEWELFDLKKDPLQLHNLYGEPGTERLLSRLRAELVRLQTLYQDPIAEKNGF